MIGLPKSYVRKLSLIDQKKNVILKQVEKKQIDCDFNLFMLGIKSDVNKDSGTIPPAAFDLKDMLEEIK